MSAVVDNLATREQIDAWVRQVFDSVNNIATESELLEQANVAIINFARSDQDSSGTISFEELPLLCNHMGLPIQPEEDDQLLKMDKDGSGVLELEEWVLWWLGRVSCLPNPLAQQEVMAKNTFKRFDTDGSGTMSTSEMRTLFETLGARLSESELHEAMLTLDSDSSGNIDQNEFIAWWTNRIASKRKGGGLIALKLKRLAAKVSQIFNTDIFQAVWSGDKELVASFLQADKRFANASDTSDFGKGWTPLQYAAYRGEREIVSILLAAGAKLNSRNDDGFTALFYAAQQEHVDICSELIDLGADPTLSGKQAVVDSDGVQRMRAFCPMDVSVDNSNIVDILKSHPKYSAPKILSQWRASLSNRGLLQITISFPKESSLRFVSVQLSVESSKEMAKGSTDDCLVYSCKIPLSLPQDGPCIEVVVERSFMNAVVSLGAFAAVSCRLAAIDAFRDLGPLSDSKAVEYEAPVQRLASSASAGTCATVTPTATDEHDAVGQEPPS